jgi:hypothetical protein
MTITNSNLNRESLHDSAARETTSVNPASIDTFICVHQRDVDYLLGLVLRSYEANFGPKGTLTLVTNDLPYLRDFVDRLAMDTHVVLTSDSDWLSKRELELPGWYRQQIIKLRAYQFCSTPNFCNLGADTLLLRPIDEHDLLVGGVPILYYSRHRIPDQHLLYEWRRVHQVARILQVKPTIARRYTDFINDFFCFNREWLIELNTYLEKQYGPEYYYTLLQNLNTKGDQNKFGEWTLYSVYLLDCLQAPVTLRNAHSGFLHQVHSHRTLSSYRFDTQVVHFVGKQFDVGYIEQQMRKFGLTLAN